MNDKNAKAQFEQHKHDTLKAVHGETDARKAMRTLLLAQVAALRAGFTQEHAKQQAAYDDTMALVDANEASIDAALDAVFANTGK